MSVSAAAIDNTPSHGRPVPFWQDNVRHTEVWAPLVGTCFWEAENRSHIGKMKKLESKRRRRWRANDFHVTSPKNKCNRTLPLLSESVFSPAQLTFSQTLAWMKLPPGLTKVLNWSYCMCSQSSDVLKRDYSFSLEKWQDSSRVLGMLSPAEQWSEVECNDFLLPSVPIIYLNTNAL